MLVQSHYQDLGQVVEGLAMAAGATAYSPYYDGLGWVRNVLMFAQSDQQYDVGYFRRDTGNNADASGGGVANNQGAYPTSFRPNVAVGAQGIIGYSCRFWIKNSSASPNTYGRVRVQLMGL